MRSNLVSDWLIPFCTISAAYLLSFYLSFAVILPVQHALHLQFDAVAMLVFLPHGVRVLTAWLYGARAILFLPPATFVTYFYLFGADGLSLPRILGPVAGILCAPLAFHIFARAGFDFHFGGPRLVGWREIILVGAVASVLNSFGAAIFRGTNLHGTLAYLLGDTFGLVVCMALLMLGFRVARVQRR